MLSCKVNEGTFFEIVQGEDLTINLQVFDEESAPFNLTGYTILGRFVKIDGTAGVENGMVTVAAAGQATLSIPAADSMNLRAGARQDWELFLSQANNNRIIIVSRGVSVFLPTV